MRVVLFVFAALLVNVAFAVEDAPPHHSLTPNCGNACPTPAPKPLRIAKVEKAKDPFCACLEKPDCSCKPKTVEPEIKEPKVHCGCLDAPGACACRPHNYQLVKDHCGCLHLQKCPCRMEYVEPETKEPHLEPELKDRKSHHCGCIKEPVCGCRPKTVTPEIKDPPCPCGDKPKSHCACSSLHSN